MKKQSAGVLPYKLINEEPFFFIVHPGGPFYSKKDDGFWSIVKGEMEEGEDPLKAAKREFEEETTIQLKGKFIPLTPIKQKSGKTVHAWAIETNFPTENLKSNTFPLVWPPHSGKTIDCPELDKFEWFDAPTTIKKLMPAQVPLVEEVLSLLEAGK